jgi:hypothetical protein
MGRVLWWNKPNPFPELEDDMRTLMKTLGRRQRGMSALQAVILLGAAFVVVWGLMQIWKATEPDLERQARQTLSGIPGTPSPGNGAGANANPAPTPTPKPQPKPTPTPTPKDSKGEGAKPGTTPKPDGEQAKGDKKNEITTSDIISGISQGLDTVKDNLEESIKIATEKQAAIDAAKNKILEGQQKILEARTKEILGAKDYELANKLPGGKTKDFRNALGDVRFEEAEALAREGEKLIQEGVEDLAKSGKFPDGFRDLPNGKATQEFVKKLGKKAGIVGNILDLYDFGNDTYNAVLNGDKRGVVVAGTKAVGGITGGIAGAQGGAWAGAATGGAIGSVVPIVGTAAGAAVGAVVGAIGGAILGSSVGKDVGASLGDVVSNELEYPTVPQGPQRSLLWDSADYVTGALGQGKNAVVGSVSGFFSGW